LQFEANPGKLFKRPYFGGKKKTLHKKKAGGVAQGVGPEFKPQYQKKNKNPEKCICTHTDLFLSLFPEQ
jgi:hypothetical protein